MRKTIDVRTGARTEFIDITSSIASAVKESGVESGSCLVFVPHTTAAVTINEGADPSVRSDILRALNSLIPFSANYEHSEGNSAAHIKASIIGSSVEVIIDRGELLLGTWQSIYFCEFDGPRHRSVHIQVRAES